MSAYERSTRVFVAPSPRCGPLTPSRSVSFLLSTPTHSLHTGNESILSSGMRIMDTSKHVAIINLESEMPHISYIYNIRSVRVPNSSKEHLTPTTSKNWDPRVSSRPGTQKLVEYITRIVGVIFLMVNAMTNLFWTGEIRLAEPITVRSHFELWPGRWWTLRASRIGTLLYSKRFDFDRRRVNRYDGEEEGERCAGKDALHPRSGCMKRPRSRRC